MISNSWIYGPQAIFFSKISTHPEPMHETYRLTGIGIMVNATLRKRKEKRKKNPENNLCFQEIFSDFYSQIQGMCI